jgi:transaldolase
MLPTRRNGIPGQGERAVNQLKQLETRGQSPWLDYLERSLTEKGALCTLIERDGLKGVTSNTSSFEKAVGETDEYAEALNQSQAQSYHSISAIYEHLAIAGIRAAADVSRPAYEQNHGRDGNIRLECSPNVANDTDVTIAGALRLWAAIERPNLMVRVPASPANIPAIRQLGGRWLNINITLLFAVSVYEQPVVEACLAGVRRPTVARTRGSPKRCRSLFCGRSFHTPVCSRLRVFENSTKVCLSRSGMEHRHVLFNFVYHPGCPDRGLYSNHGDREDPARI